MTTVPEPAEMLPPWAVESPTRAAARPAMVTVPEPAVIVSGGPAQAHMSPTQAAGWPSIRTVPAPGGRIGPPVCGDPFGFAIGQVCWSVMRAAAGMGQLI